MAGIGFSLRKLNRDDSLLGLCAQYGAAGAISAGPWLISIAAILLIGVIAMQMVPATEVVPQFQVAVTYLFAGSLVLSGPLQLLYTRFVADRVFAGEEELILPNLFGAMVVTGVAAAAVATVALVPIDDCSALSRVLIGESFVVLCCVWLVVLPLTGLERYGSVLLCFAGAYTITFGCAPLLASFGLEGFLASFVVGQVFLLFSSLHIIARHYPGRGLVRFDFLRRGRVFPSLALTGLLFNLGIWIDKFLFWALPSTSGEVLGWLRASHVYDVPVFLAYLAVVPGMAAFLVRVETDFAEHYRGFYGAVRRGAPLVRIEELRDRMTMAARRGIFEIIKVQGLTLAGFLVFAPEALELFGISQLHLPMLYVHATGASIQVLLLAVLNVFFYLDRRATALWLCVVFCVGNAAGTLLSQQLGYVFYGYGFASAALLACLIGLAKLSRTFDTLVQDTFMLQRGGSK